MNDPVLVAKTLPELGEGAMRAAVAAALRRRHPVTERWLANEALVQFEALVQAKVSDGVRPASLFAERDRIVSELRRFAGSKLAARCFGIARRNVLAAGRTALPFDALVRGRDGGAYGLTLRRLPSGAERLAVLPTAHTQTTGSWAEPIRGVVTYDFRTGKTSVVRFTRDRRARASASRSYKTYLVPAQEPLQKRAASG
ncbi:MAG TPA: hypothetical protein VGK84_10295 [Candidatus Tumulicola sp.]